MPTVRIGPMIGLIAHIALLASLAAMVGLGLAGWLVAGASGVVTCLILTVAMHRAGTVTLGPADRITLARTALIGGVLALSVDTFGGPVGAPMPVALPGPVLVTIATVALVLDAVDGQVARRTGTVSALGARFDGEVDAFLILVLSVYVARSMGWWILSIGVMRYAYLVAGWALPWLPGPLPPRLWRKTVAAVQGIVLAVATAGLIPTGLMITALAGALLLLIESFGRDIVWRWRHRLRVDAPRFTWVRAH